MRLNQFDRITLEMWSAAPDLTHDPCGGLEGRDQGAQGA